MSTPSTTKERRSFKKAGEGLILLGVALLIGVGLPLILNPDRVPSRPAPMSTLAVPVGVEVKGEVRKSGKRTAGALPLSITVPSINKTFPIAPIQLSAGNVLEPPVDPEVVGWWSKSARPGAPSGQGVFTGHSTRDDAETSALNRLATLSLEDVIIIKTAKGDRTYKVSRIEKIKRTDVSSKSVEFFSQKTDEAGRIVLITCDDFNGEDWVNNVMVFANPV